MTSPRDFPSCQLVSVEYPQLTSSLLRVTRAPNLKRPGWGPEVVRALSSLSGSPTLLAQKWTSTLDEAGSNPKVVRFGTKLPPRRSTTWIGQPYNSRNLIPKLGRFLGVHEIFDPSGKVELPMSVIVTLRVSLSFVAVCLASSGGW